MFTINKFESKYKPFVTLHCENIGDLFESTRIEKHCKNSPQQESAELWLNIEGFFNGKSVYVKPCPELSSIIENLNIYGTPRYKDIYLKVSKVGEKYTLDIQYQQIIGSYKLFNLTEDHYKQLLELFNADTNN